MMLTRLSPLPASVRKALQSCMAMQRNLARREDGIAAVEFALLLPLLISTYMGLVEVSLGMRASQRIDLATHTLSDLVAQELPSKPLNETEPKLDQTDINNIFRAAEIIMADDAHLSYIKMTVTEVAITGTPAGAPTSWTAKPTWTVTKNGGTARSCTTLTPSTTAKPVSPATIPANYVQTTNGVQPAEKSTLIVADIVYQYTPGFNFAFFKWNQSPTWSMERTAYSAARNQTSTGHISFTGSGTTCN